MAFIEAPRFPENISRGSSGGPRWQTEIVSVQSGHEQRNARWEDSRHEYDVAYGVKDIEHLEALKAFFMVARGALHGFRYKDWADYKSGPVLAAVTDADQQIGIGDGQNTQFQLVKTYPGGIEYVRTIAKPVTGTVVVAVDGNPVTPVVDHTTGMITVTPAPTQDAIVTAGFEFDVPCRFAESVLSTQLEVFYLGSANVPLLELRL